VARGARPRAVVFDAYGTLFDLNAAVARHAALLGDRAASVSARWRAKQLEYAWVLSLAGAYEQFETLTERALDYALAEAGIDGADGQGAGLRARLLQAYRRLDAYPDAMPALVALREAGVPAAILSNGSPGMLAAAIEAGGLGGLLDAVLSVDAVGRYKPDPAVYQMACERFGCAPGEILFVSGNAWDGYGAARVGLRVVRVARTPLPEEYGLPGEVERVPGLGSVAALLG